jgi:ABC-type spermidine/putrescine transport system permease subunit II
MESRRTSARLSVGTGVASTVLALLGARSYMKLDARHKRWLLMLLLLPVLIPGVILGLGLLSYFQILQIETGLPTMFLAEVLWTLPFATLIVLTSMSSLSPTLRRASYDLGASRWETFRRVEFPLIQPGVLGAFLFSFLLAFNEFSRAHFVSGRSTTFPVYLYTHAYTGGLPKTVYAVSTVLVLGTFLLVAVYAAYLRTRQDPASKS